MSTAMVVVEAVQERQALHQVSLVMVEVPEGALVLQALLRQVAPMVLVEEAVAGVMALRPQEVPSLAVAAAQVLLLERLV